jgi:hypothetical protein
LGGIARPREMPPFAAVKHCKRVSRRWSLTFSGTSRHFRPLCLKESVGRMHNARGKSQVPLHSTNGTADHSESEMNASPASSSNGRRQAIHRRKCRRAVRGVRRDRWVGRGRLRRAGEEPATWDQRWPRWPPPPVAPNSPFALLPLHILLLLLHPTITRIHIG